MNDWCAMVTDPDGFWTPRFVKIGSSQTASNTTSPLPGPPDNYATPCNRALQVYKTESQDDRQVLAAMGGITGFGPEPGVATSEAANIPYLEGAIDQLLALAPFLAQEGGVGATVVSDHLRARKKELDKALGP